MGASPARTFVRILALLLASLIVLPSWALAATPGGYMSGATPAASSVVPRASGPTYVPGEVLVKFKAGLAATAKAAGLARLGLQGERVIGRNSGVELLRLPKGVSVEAAVAALKRTGLVEYAEPNYIGYVMAQPPNDPKFSDLWGLHNTTHPGIDIGVLAAWDVTQGDPNVVVGVMDTGTDLRHPDLKNNVWVNPGEIPNDGQDNDGNGYVDDVNGYNFWDSNPSVFDPFDVEEHGTHVAGTIAAEANNNVGVAGVAPKVKVMSLKICKQPFCSYGAAIQAFDYATTMLKKGVNVRVINASWGGPKYSQALYDAIAAYGLWGGIVVAAAGNDGANNDVSPHYPASYDLPNIIAVAAVDPSGNLASFSNYGATTVDLGAPGVGIESTLPMVPRGPAAATVTDATYRYRAVTWGFGAESITVPGAVYDAVYRTMNYLGVPRAAACSWWTTTRAVAEGPGRLTSSPLMFLLSCTTGTTRSSTPSPRT